MNFWNDSIEPGTAAFAMVAESFDAAGLSTTAADAHDEYDADLEQDV
ncbi:hypothetical protein [Lysobacter panacisoli]|uniref:Uncharacterized protein n=1 Tax=Lysobacter panacisoli TaxID=1255263 RepID=A0ABP9L6N0_9GAMM|nr:hypothetical protein [Lysobacter panacisoli]